MECLPGVEVICSPEELNVKLRDKEQFKWIFTLSFKVSRHYDGEVINASTRKS